MSGKAIQGTIDRVPCPHCGKGQDFRVLQQQQLLDTGHQLFCDFCGRSQEIVRIITVTHVAVRQDPSGKVRPTAHNRQLTPQQAAARQRALAGAQAKKPGILSRLLGKG